MTWHTYTPLNCWKQFKNKASNTAAIAILATKPETDTAVLSVLQRSPSQQSILHNLNIVSSGTVWKFAHCKEKVIKNDNDNNNANDIDTDNKNEW